MFCPNYGGKCRGGECREWNKQELKCQYELDSARRRVMDEEYRKLVSIMEAFSEAQRLNTLQTQANLLALLKLPILPPEIREFIQKILEAPSSEVAKKLIDELNL